MTTVCSKCGQVIGRGWRGHELDCKTSEVQEKIVTRKIIGSILLVFGFMILAYMVHLRLLEIECLRCGVWKWEVCSEMEAICQARQ